MGLPIVKGDFLNYKCYFMTFVHQGPLLSATKLQRQAIFFPKPFLFHKQSITTSDLKCDTCDLKCEPPRYTTALDHESLHPFPACFSHKLPPLEKHCSSGPETRKYLALLRRRQETVSRNSIFRSIYCSSALDLVAGRAGLFGNISAAITSLELLIIDVVANSLRFLSINYLLCSAKKKESIFSQLLHGNG